MSINNPSFSKFDSLRTRYISGATTLLILCVLFSSLAYLNVSNMLTSAATGSRYQQQYRNHLNDFSESFFNIEKLLMYYPQASNEVVYKQLLDNLSIAEDSLQKIEYGRWFIAHEQRNVIAEIHSYISTYKLRISWQMNAGKSKDNVVLDVQPDIDNFAEDLWPMIDNVRQSINKLENELETLSVIERSRIADVEEFLLFTFIGGISLIIGFLLINFVAIKRWVINPLLLLTDDIDTDSDFSKRCYTNVLEINGLFNSLENRCIRNSKREDKLKYQVMHDPLTGLPNRVMLKNTLQSAIDDADKTSTQFTLLMIDLDRFKEINDTLGHHVGDKVLCEISKRFKFVLSHRDVIARLGGDEFAVLLYDTEVEKARFTAQELLNCFKDDMLLEGHRLNIGGSIGMAVYPWHAKNEQELLQRADVAMYFAKRKNFGYAIYDKSEDKHDIRQLGFEVELRDAIENNELTLHYQPKIDIKSKQVVSVEVLLRWNHQEHGFIPAEEISMLAEKTGLITDLSKWVVLTAVNQLSLWVKKGIELPVSINLSVWNLQDPDFFSYVETTLTRSSLPAEMITFEITESAVMSDPESALKTLQQISKLGARISIDDYGTGFSSLQYLKILPINEIKIDKSFVTDMVDYENDAVIVRSIIDLSHNLGLSVVAEGVETQDVYDILEILRCDVIQGYHVSRPITSEKLEEWLMQYTNDAVRSKLDNVTYIYH